ncbi:MAG: GNAT family N-acetyltransferase, partial [Lachnospiraceae bacterium]|nr:GNAT family N-acetyltransferase [Lachnospiraceae bacterium]
SFRCYAYEMIDDNNEILGGAIVEINEDNINHLDFLFVRVGIQSKGIGQAIWKEVENSYPDTKIWKTCTPYFDKRNIHFYVNKLKFKIVQYFNKKYPDPNMSEDIYEEDDGMFEFEKDMNKS